MSDAKFSLSELVGDATPASAGSYLSTLKVSSTAGGAGLGGYLNTLRVQAAQSAASNPAGYLDTLRVASSGVTGTGPATYLDNLKGAASVVAKVEAASEAAMTSNEPVLAAINKLNDYMNKNQKATIDVLQDINSTIKKLAIRAENKATVQPEQTELTRALESSAAPAVAWSGSSWK